MTARSLPLGGGVARRWLPGLRVGERAESRPVDLGPVSVRRLLARFVIAGLIAVIAVSLISAKLSRDAAVDLAVSQALQRSQEDFAQFVEPVLVDAVLRGDPAALATLDSVVRSTVLHGSLQSVKIWTSDGTVVYATDERLVGEQFELDDDELSVLETHEAVAGESDLSAPENVFDEGESMIEIYGPASTVEGTELLYETYHRRSDLNAVGSDISSRFIVIALVAVGVVELVQLPLALQLARRLRSGQQRQGRLLSGAMAASEAERRRIAGDLHGGALQELVGSSMSLAAARSGEADDDARLDAVGNGLSRGVGSLRTLLYDLPSVAEWGDTAPDVESTMESLLARFAGSDTRAKLNFASDGAPVDDVVTALLRRTAHELVREVADAAVSDVRLDVECQAGAVDVLISDDRAHPAGAPVNTTAVIAESAVMVALGELIDAAGGFISAGCGLSSGRWTRVHLPALDS